MHAAAQAAVGAGDDVFSADDVSEGDDAIGHQFGVLDVKILCQVLDLGIGRSLLTVELCMTR